MGYACPVCEDPQADADHLANHLAFTALLRGGDHETWLDEHVPDWADMSEADLAAVVPDHVEETEFPELFEDTTGDQAGHEHAGHDYADLPDGAPAGFEGDLDEAARETLAEARELTRERRSDSETE